MSDRRLTLWCYHCTATVTMPVANGMADITPADGWEITLEPERDVRCPKCAYAAGDTLPAALDRLEPFGVTEPVERRLVRRRDERGGCIGCGCVVPLFITACAAPLAVATVARLRNTATPRG